MEPGEIHAALQKRFGDAVGDLRAEGVCDPAIPVDASAVGRAAEFLHDEPSLAFDSLQCLAAVDYPTPAESARIEVLYHLYSFEHRHKIVLRTSLSRERPVCPSVAPIWPTADWHEREAYDLMGVVFPGHPNLTRILLPHDWEGHPLRKDYEPPEEYQGIRNQ